MSLLDDAITVIASGATISTSGTSARVALPNMSSGEGPRYIRVSATAAAYVKLGKDNTVTAAAGDLLVQPADAVILSVNRNTYIAAIQVAGAGVVQVSPLENM